MMKLCFWFIPLLALSGCWSRPCCVAANIPPAPCRAEGEDADDWRIATAVCRKLEGTGAEVEEAKVNGASLTLTFAQKFGQQLAADQASLRLNVEEFLSMMMRETGSQVVSVHMYSGETPIASGKTSESGELQITVLE